LFCVLGLGGRNVTLFFCKLYSLQLNPDNNGTAGRIREIFFHSPRKIQTIMYPQKNRDKNFLLDKIQTIIREARALQKNVDNLWILINKIILYELK
jgi:hypothetical protein